ncbi:hypothetical protein BKA62DRAFT_696865 [Auriculariales sp. MPI-PUGE-AT-0066]|nr:hypothetical protein BKA62DRAFT_696865 [Auriculariales sp. MPI-PUGE-AT-0066]
MELEAQAMNLVTRNTLSHGKMLPAEIWLKVFLFMKVWSNEWDTAITDFPLLLTRVCRQWRQLARSCSELWTLVCCKIRADSMQRGALKGHEDWLACTGYQPITLNISCDIQDPTLINPFLQLYYAHFAHVRALRIRMSYRLTGRALDPPPQNALPICEEICTSINGNSNISWLCPVFQGKIPRLRSLKMDRNTSGTQLLLPVEAHLCNLVSLDAACNNFRLHPADIIRSCPHLVHCRLLFRLSNEQVRMWDVPNAAPFIIPHLRTLRLGDWDAYNWRDVFSLASFPALEELTIIGHMWPISSFVPFLKRSQCQLRALVFQSTNIPADALLDILRCISSSLKQLSIEQIDMLLVALTPNADSKIIVTPLLEVLKIQSQGPFAHTDGRLIDLVRARMAGLVTGVATLKEITVECGNMTTG